MLRLCGSGRAEPYAACAIVNRVSLQSRAFVMAVSPRVRSVLKWTGIVCFALVALTLLTLALVDWNRLKGPIERSASARSGRTVSISGPPPAH